MGISYDGVTAGGDLKKEWKKHFQSSMEKKNRNCFYKRRQKIYRETDNK